MWGLWAFNKLLSFKWGHFHLTIYPKDSKRWWWSVFDVPLFAALYVNCIFKTPLQGNLPSLVGPYIANCHSLWTCRKVFGHMSFNCSSPLLCDQWSELTCSKGIMLFTYLSSIFKVEFGVNVANRTITMTCQMQEYNNFKIKGSVTMFNSKEA